MALDTASSSKTLTASSRVSTPFLTRARNSATVAVTAAIVYAASSNEFISRFPVMIQTAAGSHITRHQRRMRQDGRASSKGSDGCASGWLHFKGTTTVGRGLRSVIGIQQFTAKFGRRFITRLRGRTTA